jgi:wyosine [tRNA(Phe)-imidazoG37] synthetase (radical SAM superfamily)
MYSPVSWWRLGRWLEIDLISAQGKTCTFDCAYCQLGPTTCFADRREVFVKLSNCGLKWLPCRPSK